MCYQLSLKSILCCEIISGEAMIRALSNIIDSGLQTLTCDQHIKTLVPAS